MRLRWIGLFALLALAAAAVFLMHRYQTLSFRLTQLEAENRSLHAEIARLAANNTQIAPPSAPAKEQALRSGCEELLKQRPSPALGPSPAEQNLEQARQQLAAAKDSVAELNAKLKETEEAVQKLNEQLAQMKAADEESKDRLAANARLIETMQQELKSKDLTMAKLQADFNRLSGETRKTSDRLNRVTQASREIEDINRRRETYLTNILRRYREMTEVYRTMSMRIDKPSETNPAQPAELGRIQTAITMAEEDFRQLQTLNIQAQRAQSRMQ
jgi:chromosome segregation ATPase